MSTKDPRHYDVIIAPALEGLSLQERRDDLRQAA